MFDCTENSNTPGREGSSTLRLGGLGWRALAPPSGVRGGAEPREPANFTVPAGTLKSQNYIKKYIFYSEFQIQIQIQIFIAKTNQLKFNSFT